MPEVPVMVWVFAGFKRLLEPRVQVGGMVEHEVEDDMNAALVRFGEQGIEVLHRAELGVDGVVVGDVIAKIPVRRRIDWGEPDAVDA